MTGIKITQPFTRGIVKLIEQDLDDIDPVCFLFFPPDRCTLQLVAIWWKVCRVLDGHTIDEVLSFDNVILFQWNRCF